MPVNGSCCSYSSLAWALQTRCFISAPWNVTVEQRRQSSFFNTCKSQAGLKLLTIVNRRRKENFALEWYSHENPCIVTFCIYSSYKSSKIIVAATTLDRSACTQSVYLLIASVGLIYVTVNLIYVIGWKEETPSPLFPSPLLSILNFLLIFQIIFEPQARRTAQAVLSQKCNN